MNIGIIGAGNVGSALARGFSKAGHSVTIASREAADAQTVAASTGATAVASNADAAVDADVVVLAVPAASREAVAHDLADVAAGLTVIDVTNVMNSDMTGLTTERSGAQDLQDMLPGGFVVKAFNTVFASMQADPVVDDTPLDGFYAGDDEQAKQKVKVLLGDLGYRPIDAGPLVMARALEEMALLIVRLNAVNGWTWRSSWKLIGPTSAE